MLTFVTDVVFWFPWGNVAEGNVYVNGIVSVLDLTFTSNIAKLILNSYIFFIIVALFKSQTVAVGWHI